MRLVVTLVVGLGLLALASAVFPWALLMLVAEAIIEIAERGSKLWGSR